MPARPNPVRSSPVRSSPIRSSPSAPLAAALALAAAAALVSAALAPAAQAQDSDSLLCSQPVEPTCVGSEITYENQQRINRCRRDVERYAEQVRDYASCLTEKADLKLQEMEQLQDSFASRAEPGGSGADGAGDGSGGASAE